MYLKNKDKQLVVRLSSEHLALIEFFCKRFDCSKSDFIRMLIDWFDSCRGADN